MDLPMIIFTTCKECKGCTAFRGDGNLSDDQPWNAAFVRKLLLDGSGKKLKCLRIINIHDSDFGAELIHIKEFNLYHMIPSDLVVTPDFFNFIMSDNNPYVGDSILRVSLIKNNDMTIGISVNIDGNSTDRRCEDIKSLVSDFFFWKHIPVEFENLRKYFQAVHNNKPVENLENLVTDELKDDMFFDTLIKDYYIFCKDPSIYENLIINRFDYNWFLETFYPRRLRELEIMYPSWMLILISEWKKGLHTNDPVYAKIACCKSTLSGNQFITKKAGFEKIEDLIIQYHSGRLPLTYEGTLLQQKPKSVTFAF
jgi:hypothetical protein